MKIHDLNYCHFSYKNGSYGGLAGMKDGIIYDGELWLVKYPKNIKSLDRTGGADYSTSPLSEFIASQIYGILGYDVHETILGERNNKIVVACRDFTGPMAMLMEIRTIKNHSSSLWADVFDKSFSSTGSSHCVDLEELIMHIKNNPILNRIKGLEARFWEQAVIDILLNNNDRNNGNWGILRVFLEDGTFEDRLAPIFDNGASFNTKLSDAKISKLLEDRDSCINNACNIQVAYGKNEHVYSASKFISVVESTNEFRKAVVKVVPIIEERFDSIRELLYSIPTIHTLNNGETISVCSEDRKEFYYLQMKSRFDNLLKPCYDRVKDKVVENSDNLIMETIRKMASQR